MVLLNVECVHIVVMYTRASASDYDDWETQYGNPGWGSKALIPLLKKARFGAYLWPREDVDQISTRLRLSSLTKATWPLMEPTGPSKSRT